jgi:hypothetical protein
LGEFVGYAVYNVVSRGGTGICGEDYTAGERDGHDCGLGLILLYTPRETSPGFNCDGSIDIG